MLKPPRTEKPGKFSPRHLAPHDNPSGNSYGWGYTGSTGDWIQERVDLSQFAGQKVQIRFEYVTDAAVNEEGFLLTMFRSRRSTIRKTLSQEMEAGKPPGLSASITRCHKPIA